MKAAEWIDQVKQARGWESDYRAAKELGLSRNSISGYRTAIRTFDDDTAVKVAEALDLEPEIVLLDQFTERTKSEPARAALTALLAKLSRPFAGGSGTRHRLDITSAASISGGDPESGGGVRPIARKYTSYKATGRHSFTHTALQTLEAFFSSATSYSGPLKPA